MRYVCDNDLHIHSQLSRCSRDPEQNAERILQYGKDYNLKTICVTDHFWDSSVEGASEWYRTQNFEHLAQIKPLPQSKDVRFLFGCETELDKFLHLGISKEHFDLFDFVIIPTTHFHMEGFTLSKEQGATFESKAKAWVDRLNGVLNMDLPFHKIGIAHLTCFLMAKSRGGKEFSEIMNLVSDKDLYKLFEKAANVGVGIEINAGCMVFPEEVQDAVLRPYRIAKECGCKFYMGSDAHHPKELDCAGKFFKKAVDLLDLQESDKFVLQA